MQTVFHKQKAWAVSCGLHEPIVRVSVGLEDKEARLAAFTDALKVAYKWKQSRKLGGDKCVKNSVPLIEA